MVRRTLPRTGLGITHTMKTDSGEWIEPQTRSEERQMLSSCAITSPPQTLDGAVDGEIRSTQWLVGGAEEVLGAMDRDRDAGVLIAASHVMGRKGGVIRGRAVSRRARWS